MKINYLSKSDTRICIVIGEGKYTLSSEDQIDIASKRGKALLFTEGGVKIMLWQKIFLFLLRSIACLFKIVLFDVHKGWLSGREVFTLSTEQELEGDEINIIHTQTECRLGEYFVKKPRLSIDGRICDVEVKLDNGIVESVFLKHLFDTFWVWMYANAILILVCVFSGVFEKIVWLALITIALYTTLLCSYLKKTFKEKKRIISLSEIDA